MALLHLWRLFSFLQDQRLIFSKHLFLRLFFFDFAPFSIPTDSARDTMASSSESTTALMILLALWYRVVTYADQIPPRSSSEQLLRRCSWLRYTRLALAMAEFWGYFLLAPIHSTNTLSVIERRSDATVVAVTLGTEPQYETVIRGWLETGPKAVIITTADTQLSMLRSVLQRIGDSRISLYSVSAPSNRRQYYEGISRVKTRYFVIADDRSRWGRRTLDSILMPFQDPGVGGVTGIQAVKPASGRLLSVWESFGALNLVRRNVQHSALSYFHHGQVLNLSGRLSAFRTSIFQDAGFRDAFLNDTWRGRFPITTGDDNALTTWVLRQGWKTCFQNSYDAAIGAGVYPDRRYAKQLLRWLRDTTRCYLQDLHFALCTRQERHLRRAISNLLVYFVTDSAVLLELSFLLFAWVSSSVFESEILGQGYVVRAPSRATACVLFSSPNTCRMSLRYLVLEHFLVSSALTIWEHIPFFTTLSSLRFVFTTIAYLYIRAGIALFAWLTLHKVRDIFLGRVRLGTDP
jgi:hypothetical protein